MGLITLGLVDGSLILIGFGPDEQQIIIQVISSSPRSSGITFDDILEELGNYLPDKTIYLTGQSSQYLKTDSFRLSDNRLFKLASSINKLSEDVKIKFRTEANYI